MPAYWESWIKICKMYRFEFSQHRYYEMAGTPVKDILKILIDELNSTDKPDLEEVYAMKRKLGLIAMDEIGTSKIDCVVAIALKYHVLKKPMAVASSGTREHVLHSLHENGLFELFDAIVTSEDIINQKPAPDIFLEAARRINCDPSKCVGFEDAEIGLQSLRAANIKAVDVRNLVGYPIVKASTVSVLHPNYNALNKKNSTIDIDFSGNNDN
jgi:beta-phosphoglucomutase-like phosphatase (HAD superfamily)